MSATDIRETDGMARGAGANRAAPTPSMPNRTPADIRYGFTAMASEINIWLTNPRSHAADAMEAAEAAVRDIETSCTRFNPDSALMRANRAADLWCNVTAGCFDVIELAAVAHRETAGRFDPRVLRVLQSQGYDRTLPFEQGPVHVEAPAQGAQPEPTAAFAEPWTPGLKPVTRAVRIGAVPIDLGGIGKGFAVRLAAALLRDAGEAVLIEAGGDCAALGAGPDGTGWRVAVEDPMGSSEPVAVLNLAGVSCATSSIRLRSWKVGERRVHHLIDPRTGMPGGEGLVAVTVVEPDPAWAEVWSKSLFLAGAAGIAQLADSLGLAALWVDEHGRHHSSSAMTNYVMWERNDV